MAMYGILKKHPELTFADLERCFRRFGSDNHLVARPAPASPGLKARYLGKGQPSPYWIWVSLNGEAEYDLTLLELGRTDQENLEALKECGVLMPE
jgi:hypothetical protein